MKTIYTIALLLFIAVSALGQNGQIVNGGFENWEDIQLFESPTTWKSSDEFSYYGVPTTSKSTDAQDGIHSARLDVVEVEGNPVTGFVYHGDMDNFGPTGGIPYTDNFEAISVHYKTDLNVGDSLFMLLIRYNAGVMVEVQSIPFAIGSNAAWTPTVIYTGNAVQDELFIGFLLGDPFGANNPAVGSWAIVDNVKFLSGGIETALIPNHSFEDWTSHTFESPEDWYTINDLLAGYGLENATKTTDAFSGITPLK